MKLVVMFILLSTSAFATEVATDCPAMNGSREKIVKEATTKKGKISSSQVVSQ